MSQAMRILVPLDLTPPGEAKLPTAEAYARAFGAELILLHVLPRRARVAAALADLPLPYRSARRERLEDAESSVLPEEARARAYLDTVAARMRAAGVAARPLVRAGAVASTTLAVAREERVGLIIIGSSADGADGASRAGRGLRRRSLARIARAIVRSAPCPVLLVRPDLAAAAPAPAVRAFAEDATRAGLLAPRRLGLRTVDVARIVGSVGRAAEMGADFRPLRASEAERQRYARLRELAEWGRPIPPIELYKLGYGYYVVDGHRRVAAAKQHGQPEIDAIVTEFVPMDDPQAQRLFSARRAFEAATGLTRVGAARPETYARLLEQIDGYAALHGLANRHEAAARWHNEVFRPLARRIRSLRLNTGFPGERSADIFVRLADHRRAEAERRGCEVDGVSWEDALGSIATPQPTTGGEA